MPVFEVDASQFSRHAVLALADCRGVPAISPLASWSASHLSRPAGGLYGIAVHVPVHANAMLQRRTAA